MNILIVAAALLALGSGIFAVTRMHIIHAVLFIDVSFFFLALVMGALGAPFAAILEIITYAGAIMVVFMYAIMLLNPGPNAVKRERRRQPLILWIGPTIVGVIVLLEIVYAVFTNLSWTPRGAAIGPTEVGISLFRDYLPMVELASILLLAALVGACYIGKRPEQSAEKADPQ